MRVFFFLKVSKFYVDCSNEAKTSENLDFELIALEFFALKISFYWEAILFIGCQYFNKQSKDSRHY